MELSFILSVRKTIVLFVTFVFSGLLSVSGQYRETPMPGIIVSSRIHGYWEHLPAEYYANPTKKYPLILVLHGSGERGRDNEAQLKWGGSLFADPAKRAGFMSATGWSRSAASPSKKPPTSAACSSASVPGARRNTRS